MALIIKSYLIRQYSIILGILIMPEVMMMNINFKKANGSLLKIFQQKNIAYHYKRF